MSIEERVLKLIANSSDSAEAVIRSAKNWQDIELDSLQTVELILATEDEFDITIEDEDAEGIKCFDDLVNFIKGKSE